jgi:hypothetical protein
MHDIAALSADHLLSQLMQNIHKLLCNYQSPSQVWNSLLQLCKVHGVSCFHVIETFWWIPLSTRYIPFLKHTRIGKRPQ